MHYHVGISSLLTGYGFRIFVEEGAREDWENSLKLSGNEGGGGPELNNQKIVKN